MFVIKVFVYCGIIKTNIMEIDYGKITNNKEVVKLLKEMRDIEIKINNIDPYALFNFEVEKVSNN